MAKCNCDNSYEESEGKLEGYCDHCIETCKKCGEQISKKQFIKIGYCDECKDLVVRTCYWCKHYDSGEPILDETCYLIEHIQGWIIKNDGVREKEKIILEILEVHKNLSHNDICGIEEIELEKHIKEKGFRKNGCKYWEGR